MLSMLLEVNGTRVQVNRLPFDGHSGHILQFLVASGGEHLYEQILAGLKEVYKDGGGLMHNDEPDEKGQREIRIICGLVLPTIRMLEKLGLVVNQIE